MTHHGSQQNHQHDDQHIVREVEPAEWEPLLENFPAHSVFHTLPWLQTLETVHGAQLVLTKAELNGRCTAIWPVLTTRKGWLRVAGSPLPGFNTAYMGPLFRSRSDIHGALTAFLQERLFCKSAYFSCKVLNTAHPVDLSRHGFKQVLEFDTYCIDLSQSEETLWSNLKSECRTQIRKARKLGIDVKVETSSEFIDEYWAMSLDTFNYQQVRPLFSKQFLEVMWERLARKQILGLSAWHGGRRVAALMLPMDHQTMYYWSGVSYTRLRRLPSHNVLHWEAIRLAKQHGLRHYDFVSTLGNAGRFKRTFGPKTITVATHWERCSSRFTQAIKDQYERFVMKRQQIATMAPAMMSCSAAISG